MKFQGLQMLTLLPAQSQPCLGLSPPKLQPLHVPGELPQAHLASPALKGRRVTGQKPDSVFIHQTLRGPSRVSSPPKASAASEGEVSLAISHAQHTWYSCPRRLASRKSIQAGPEARENLLKHKKELPLSGISQEKTSTSCGLR